MQTRLPNTGPLESSELNLPSVLSEGENVMSLTSRYVVLMFTMGTSTTGTTVLDRSELCKRRLQ